MADVNILRVSFFMVIEIFCQIATADDVQDGQSIFWCHKRGLIKLCDIVNIAFNFMNTTANSGLWHVNPKLFIRNKLCCLGRQILSEQETMPAKTVDRRLSN